MANTIFANIPMEGSGQRPLDADLYGAEQHAGDIENISATGNLNIGQVLQYDEHAQRQGSGGAARDGMTASVVPPSMSGGASMLYQPSTAGGDNLAANEGSATRSAPAGNVSAPVAFFGGAAGPVSSASQPGANPAEIGIASARSSTGGDTVNSAALEPRAPAGSADTGGGNAAARTSSTTVNQQIFNHADHHTTTNTVTNTTNTNTTTTDGAPAAGAQNTTINNNTVNTTINNTTQTVNTTNETVNTTSTTIIHENGGGHPGHDPLPPVDGPGSNNPHDPQHHDHGLVGEIIHTTVHEIHAIDTALNNIFHGGHDGHNPGGGQGGADCHHPHDCHLPLIELVDHVVHDAVRIADTGLHEVLQQATPLIAPVTAVIAQAGDTLSQVIGQTPVASVLPAESAMASAMPEAPLGAIVVAALTPALGGTGTDLAEITGAIANASDPVQHLSSTVVSTLDSIGVVGESGAGGPTAEHSSATPLIAPVATGAVLAVADAIAAPLINPSAASDSLGHQAGGDGAGLATGGLTGVTEGAASLTAPVSAIVEAEPQGTVAAVTGDAPGVNLGSLHADATALPTSLAAMADPLPDHGTASAGSSAGQGLSSLTAPVVETASNVTTVSAPGAADVTHAIGGTGLTIPTLSIPTTEPVVPMVATVLETATHTTEAAATNSPAAHDPVATLSAMTASAASAAPVDGGALFNTAHGVAAASHETVTPAPVHQTADHLTAGLHMHG